MLQPRVINDGEQGHCCFNKQELTCINEWGPFQGSHLRDVCAYCKDTLLKSLLGRQLCFRILCNTGFKAFVFPTLFLEITCWRAWGGTYVTHGTSQHLPITVSSRLKEKALELQCIQSSTPIHSKVVWLCPQRAEVAKKCISKKPIGLSLKGWISVFQGEKHGRAC